MLQESKQGTSNYKADERRKQVQKHYQIRTRDYLQEHWNYYYPETWNTRQYGYTEYPQHASERENEDKRHGGLNRSWWWIGYTGSPINQLVKSTNPWVIIIIIIIILLLLIYWSNFL